MIVLEIAFYIFVIAVLAAVIYIGNENRRIYLYKNRNGDYLVTFGSFTSDKTYYESYVGFEELLKAVKELFRDNPNVELMGEDPSLKACLHFKYIPKETLNDLRNMAAQVKQKTIMRKEVAKARTKAEFFEELVK